MKLIRLHLMAKATRLLIVCENHFTSRSGLAEHTHQVQVVEETHERFAFVVQQYHVLRHNGQIKGRMLPAGQIVLVWITRAH